MLAVEKHEKALLGVEKQINQNGANLATLKLLEIQGLRNVSSVGQITAYKPTYDLNTAKDALDTTGNVSSNMVVTGRSRNVLLTFDLACGRGGAIRHDRDVAATQELERVIWLQATSKRDIAKEGQGQCQIT